MKMRVHEHLIISMDDDQSYFSLAEHGLISDTYAEARILPS
ncbi:MAG: hypothetical protein ACKVE4_02995 [Dissulfuribacterales bacterium]